MVNLTPIKKSFLACFVLLCLLSAPAVAQDGYQRPPEVIAKLIEAPSTPSVSIDSKGEWMLLMERPGYPSIEQSRHLNYASEERASILTPTAEAESHT
jgi:opacity protein-like surface antigen